MKFIILFLLPKRFDAITLFSRVYMRVKYKYVLFIHEEMHAQQQHRNPMRFYFRYLFSKKWRLEYEAEAYAESVNAGENIVSAAFYLANNYRLGITEKQARDAIERYL